MNTSSIMGGRYISGSVQVGNGTISPIETKVRKKASMFVNKWIFELKDVPISQRDHDKLFSVLSRYYRSRSGDSELVRTVLPDGAITICGRASFALLQRIGLAGYALENQDG